MKKIIKIIGNILSVLAVIFVIYKLTQMDFSVLKIVSLTKLVPALLFGTVLAVISVFLLGFIWSRTVKYFSLQRKNDNIAADKLSKHQLPDVQNLSDSSAQSMQPNNLSNISAKAFHKQAVCVYSKANLAKYIPGNVFQYVERNLFLSGSGLDQFDIAASTLIEILGLFCSGILLGLLLSYNSLRTFLSNYMSFPVNILIIALLLLGILVSILLYRRSLKIRELIRRIFKKDFIKLFLLNILLYAAALIIIASIMLPIYKTLSSSFSAPALNFETCSIIISAYIISWLAGYIVIGAPGGIGIRELVISLIISDPSIREILLMTAIIQRFVTIAGDAAAAGIYVVTIRRLSKTH